MDPSATGAFVISAAALFSTIVGPIINSAITCAHESRMYKKRFYIEHEHEVIERYLRAVGRFAYSTKEEHSRDLGEATAEIFMYAPKPLWDDIRKINETIQLLLKSSEYERRTHYTEVLRCSYLELCEKFSDLRRSSKKK